LHQKERKTKGGKKGTPINGGGDFPANLLRGEPRGGRGYNICKSDVQPKTGGEEKKRKSSSGKTKRQTRIGEQLYPEFALSGGGGDDLTEKKSLRGLPAGSYAGDRRGHARKKSRKRIKDRKDQGGKF